MAFKMMMSPSPLIDEGAPLVFMEGSWEYVAYLPYILHLEGRGKTTKTVYDRASLACLLWGKCLRTAVSLAGLQGMLPEEVGDELMCDTVYEAFDAYVSQQKLAWKGPPPRLCCQRRKSLFLKSVTPDVLLDDEKFSMAAVCFAGGWLLVNGGPRCRRDADLLMSVLENGEEDSDEDLEFISHVERDLLRENPEMVSFFPYILEYVPDLSGDVAFLKELVALDHNFLAYTDASLLQNREIVVTAVRQASEELGSDADLLLKAAEVLEARTPNARMRRFASDLGRRLIGGNRRELLTLAQRLVDYGVHGRQERVVPVGREDAVVPQSFRATAPLCEPTQVSCASSVEEEIRKANEMARLAKQRARLLQRRPQRKSYGRKVVPEKCFVEPSSEAPRSAGAISMKPASAVPMIISSQALEVDCGEVFSPKSGKVDRKHLKRVKLQEARAEERRRVAELFGMA